MKNKKDKQSEQVAIYAALIQEHIAEIFNEDGEGDIKIPLTDFEDSEKATAFLHALANVVPCSLYKKLTNDDVDILGFNHIANRLVCQFSKAE